MKTLHRIFVCFALGLLLALVVWGSLSGGIVSAAQPDALGVPDTIDTAPPAPAVWSGRASIFGLPPAAGRFVTAWITDVEVSQTLTQIAFEDGANRMIYQISVPGDDPATPQREGAKPGDVITFKIEGNSAPSTAVWQPGQVQIKDLTVNTADACIYAFEDLNRNGRRETNEPPLLNSNLQLKSGPISFNWAQTAQTQAHCLSNLAPGFYSLIPTFPSGYVITTPTTELSKLVGAVPQTPGGRAVVFEVGAAFAVTFTITPPPPDTPTVTPTPTHTSTSTVTSTPTLTPTPLPDGVCVRVFHDISGNGGYDVGIDPLLSGAVVRIQQVDSTEVITQWITSATQITCENNLPPGRYDVHEIPPTPQVGTWLSTTGRVRRNIEVALNARYLLNFGERLASETFTPTFTPLPSEPTSTATPTFTPTATAGSVTATRTFAPTPTFSPAGKGLCVLVCNDLNQNNRCDNGEPALAGAQVKILDQNSLTQVLASYTFTGLEFAPHCWDRTAGLRDNFFGIHAPPPAPLTTWNAYHASTETFDNGTPVPGFASLGNNYYEIFVRDGRSAYLVGYIQPPATSTPSRTPTFTPTVTTTPTVTLTPTPTPTPTQTPTLTLTSTPSHTPSVTLSPTPTLTPSLTEPPPPTFTPSLTLPPSLTPTVTQTSPPSPTPTLTSTLTPTTPASLTPTPSRTVSQTPTTTATTPPSLTPTITFTVTPTTTATRTLTRTVTPTLTPWPAGVPVAYLAIFSLQNDAIIVVYPATGTCDDLEALVMAGFYIGEGQTRYTLTGEVVALQNGWCTISIAPFVDHNAPSQTPLYLRPQPTPTATATTTTTATRTATPTSEVTPTNTRTPTPTYTLVPDPQRLYLPHIMAVPSTYPPPRSLNNHSSTLSQPSARDEGLWQTLVAWVSGLFQPSVAYAAPVAQATIPSTGRVQIIVTPSVLQDTIFTVNIYGNQISDLYSAGFTLTFDATRLAVEDADPGTPGIQISAGPFPAAPRVTLANLADNNTGRITYRVSVVPPGLPDNGDGAIASATFRAITPGVSALTLSAVEMRTEDGVLIGVGVDSGSVTVLAPTATPSPTAPVVLRPQIRLLPAATQVGIDQETRLEAYLEDIANIQAITITVSFNAALVEVADADATMAGVQIVPGTFPNPDQGTVENRVDNAAGLITYGVRLNPEAQPPGAMNGTLASMFFKGKMIGTTPVRFSSVIVRNTQGELITITSFQASITVTTPPTATPTPTATPERSRRMFLPMVIRAAFPDTARVILAPRETTAIVGSTFAVDMYIERVVNLFGAEAVLSFDPTILQVVDAQPTVNGIQVLPGDFPNSALGFVARNQVSNDQGRVHYSVTLLAPSLPVSGRGKLATILFRAVQVGETELMFETTRFVSGAASEIRSAGIPGSVQVVEQPTITPTVTPSPTVTLTPTPTLTPTRTLTITPSLTPSRTPTATRTFTITPGPSPTPSNTPTPSLTPTVTQTPTPSLTPTVTHTPTITLTPTETLTPSITPTPTMTLTPEPTFTPTLTPTPSPTLPPDQGCSNVVQNGSFETGGSEPRLAPPWVFPGQSSRRSNFRPAHTGDWYAFLGISTTQTDDRPSFSSLWQVVDVPQDATEVRLRYWYWPGSQDNNVDDDQQMAIIYKGDIADGFPINLGVLMRENRNGGGWEERTFDLLTSLREDIRGQRVTVYFTVYNNGDGQRSWLYLDDVNLSACR